MPVCMHGRMDVLMYAYMCICMQVCTYECLHMLMHAVHVWMCVCVHVSVRIVVRQKLWKHNALGEAIHTTVLESTGKQDQASCKYAYIYSFLPCA